MKQVMTTKEAANYLGLKPSTLEVWRCRGGGPVFCKYQRAVRYRPEDLQDFIESGLVHSTAEYQAISR